MQCLAGASLQLGFLFMTTPHLVSPLTFYTLEEMELILQDKLEEYLESPWYRRDLAVTHEIWEKPEVFGISGMFIFCSYITIPSLIAVHPRNGPPRTHTLRCVL